MGSLMCSLKKYPYSPQGRLNSEEEEVAKDKTFNKEKFESKLALTSRVLFLKSLALLQKLKLCKLGKETRME